MRLVVQRVRRASVAVDDLRIAAIDQGLLILVGVSVDDTTEIADRLAAKVAALRIFPDSQGRFDRSLQDTGGAALVVSQFTLLADTRRGRRPSFIKAARPELAEPLVERFAAALTAQGVQTATGRFGAQMAVELINDGPVTLVLDSAD